MKERFYWTIYFTEGTVLLNDRSFRMYDWKTNEMGRSRTMNEQIEK